MRLGAPILEPYKTPEEWVDRIREAGYGAAYAPVTVAASHREASAYASAAEAANVVIAEVGAWEGNLLADDADEVEQTIAQCQQSLRLADWLGARGCVSLSGSTGAVWGGHSADNYSPRTFDRIVAAVQRIIDGVQPDRTFYTLEVMPWAFPDGVADYKNLLDAVDRERFAVHFDPANMINDPKKFYANGELIRDFIRELGPHIRCCHAKDIVMDEAFPPWTVRLWEAIPGSGNLDWQTLLTELATLDADLPVMLEHLETAEEYRSGVEHIRRVAADLGVRLVLAE